jgi:hypothetical protein
VQNDHVVLLFEDSVLREVGRAGPHGLMIEDDELVVHQRRAGICPHFDARVLHRGKLTAVRFLVRFQAVLIVGHPADVQSALACGNQRLGNRGEVEFKGGDVNGVLRGVDLLDEHTFYGVLPLRRVVDGEVVCKIHFPP